MRHSMACPRSWMSSCVNGKLLAGGNAELQVHQIDPGDQLGDRMLDLQARIHLEEVEVALLVGDELDRAGVGVAAGLCRLHGDFAHLPPHFGGRNRRRSFFEHFLVAALHRAFALAEVDAVAMLVGENLHLDVPRILDELLDIDFAVAERALCFAARSSRTPT